MSRRCVMKLTQADAEVIAQRLLAGHERLEIGYDYGISDQTVTRYAMRGGLSHEQLRTLALASWRRRLQSNRRDRDRKRTAAGGAYSWAPHRLLRYWAQLLARHNKPPAPDSETLRLRAGVEEFRSLLGREAERRK